MSGAPPPSDPEVAAEQEYLGLALTSLAAMRARAQHLLRDLVAAGNPDLDYVAALSRRVSLLEDSPRPLLFGRIDEEDGPAWHIGRRHVEDEHADPVVVDWRAPVAVPFYRASAKEPLGLSRRRQIMVDRGSVVAVADDVFGGADADAGSTRLRGGDALLAELERARTGEMLDIVATIQAEQDEIIRAPLGELLTVQGGPGTGKTAVGLHRAAFLLYNHPPLSRDGVLVLGPSRAFLRYIAQVLPSLGEEAVVQTTIADIAPKAKVRIEEPFGVRRLKGDARMGGVLRRALEGRRHRLESDVSLRVRFARASLSAERVNEVVDSIVARPAPYKAGRAALRARLVSEARRVFRRSARLGADEAWFERELTATDEFKALLDTLWPTVSPTALVRDLLCSRSQLERCATSGLLAHNEWPMLLRSRDASSTSTSWSVDDLALLDEASFLTGGRTRTYGHIVVDEAQDLTPMQFRMVARRAPSGSITVLGDLAQATGPWAYADWSEVRAHLPDAATQRHEELTLGYRAPGRVLVYASRLLPLAAPGVTPTSSIRAGRTDPAILQVDPDELAPAALTEARALTEQLRTGRDHHSRRATSRPSPRWRKGSGMSAVLERDAMTRPVTIVPAAAAKGLEFDAVVVVEPSAFAGSGQRGLRLLYVAMTRPIQHLSIVHALPLPDVLGGLSSARSPTIRCMEVEGQSGPDHRWKQRHRRGCRAALGGCRRARRPRRRRHCPRPKIADELGGRFVHTDVADPAASTAAVAAAVEAFGGLHIAHLNAGVTSWCGMGDDFDPEAYRRSMAINLDGVVYGIAAARRAIKTSGGGTIVATASMAGLVPAPFDPIYAANKHAVVGLTRSLGQVYEPDGIRVHALCPSFAYTNIIKGSEQTLLDMGFPIIEVADVVDAFQRILDSDSTGQCWYVVAGRLSEPFEFRRAPGPRLD